MSISDEPPKLVLEHVALSAERLHEPRKLRRPELGAVGLEDGGQELLEKRRKRQIPSVQRRAVWESVEESERTRRRHFSASENPSPPLSSASLLPNNLATPKEKCINALCVISLCASTLVCISLSLRSLSKSPPTCLTAANDFASSNPRRRAEADVMAL